MSLIHGDAGGASGAAAPKHRRRGDDLETALLDAAWEEFRESGYQELTFEAVARRARTSRAVLYRRWPGKVELVAAAARHTMLRERGPAPGPSGSLREDLINMLTWANRADVRTLITATTQVSAYLAAEGVNFADIRQMVVASGPARPFSPIDEAIARGEVDPARVTPRVAGLAFDLFRHEVVLNAQPLSDETIRQIVDEVVVPLLTRPA